MKIHPGVEDAAVSTGERGHNWFFCWWSWRAVHAALSCSNTDAGYGINLAPNDMNAMLLSAQLYHDGDGGAGEDDHKTGGDADSCRPWLR